MAPDGESRFRGRTERLERSRVVYRQLVTDGFVILGGPLEGNEDVLLIIQAEGPENSAMRNRGSSDGNFECDLRITTVLIAIMLEYRFSMSSLSFRLLTANKVTTSESF